VENDELTHTTARTEADPEWPDQVTKGRVADVKVDEQGRFALPVKGRSLAVLPVTRDVLWLEYGPMSWAKLRRVGR
jgi:hypothetical protein